MSKNIPHIYYHATQRLNRRALLHNLNRGGLDFILKIPSKLFGNVSGTLTGSQKMIFEPCLLKGKRICIIFSHDSKKYSTCAIDLRSEKIF